MNPKLKDSNNLLPSRLGSVKIMDYSLFCKGISFISEMCALQLGLMGQVEFLVRPCYNYDLGELGFIGKSSKQVIVKTKFVTASHIKARMNNV